MYFPTTFSVDLKEALQTQTWDNVLTHLEQSPSNRQAMMTWILNTFEAIQFLRSHLDLSFKILRVLSRESAPQDFFRLENICKLFRSRVLVHQENVHLYAGVQEEVWESENRKMKEWANTDRTAFIQYLNSKDENDWTPMHWAASDGNIGFFKLIKETDPKLFATLLQKRNKINMTPLYLAFSQQQRTVLEYFSRHERYLFEQFLDEQQGPSNTISLLEAVKNGDGPFCELVGLEHPEMFVRLIQQKDANGMNTVHWAAYKGRPAVIDLVHRIEPGLFGKLLEIRDLENFTPIHGAVLGMNYPFIKTVASLYPNIYERFMQAKEPTLMQKILDTTDGDNSSLLSQITARGQVELLDLLNKKAPALFIEYVKKEDPDHKTPFKNAIDNQQPGVLDFFYRTYPELFRQILTIEYLCTICADLPAKGTLLRRYCTEPVIAGILFTLLKLYEGSIEEAVQEIQANVAKPHAHEFIKAMLRSEKLLKFLNKNDGVLTAWFEQNPAKVFLTHEQRLDLILQLPPSQIYSTVEEITIESCEAMIRTRVFLEGEFFQIREVLNLTQAQFGDHLDEESASTCAQEYLGHIKPKFLVAAFNSDDLKETVLNFLEIIPDPLYRVLIPLLDGEEFINFLENVHFVNKAPYLGTATCQQKIDFLNELESPVTDEVKAWKQQVLTLYQSLTEALQTTTPIKAVALHLYTQLKNSWSQGHGHFITLAQNQAILHQIQHKMQTVENNEPLQAMISSILVPVIQEAQNVCTEIEGLRNKIFRELANHPLLAVEEPPDEFYCPISGAIMTDPVIDKYGNTFERASITEWIQIRGTSPINRQPLTLEDLRPNEDLKARIQAHGRG